MNNATQIDLSDFYNSDDDLIDAELKALMREPLSEVEVQKIEGEIEELFANLSPCPDTVDAVRKWDSKQRLVIRHKEGNDMKRQVFDWLNSNWDGKCQAEAKRKLIDANLVYMKASTIKTWVSEYNEGRLNK